MLAVPYITSFGIIALNQVSTKPGATQESLLESKRRAAAAGTGQIPGVERTVRVLATPWMSTSDIDAATALARQLGVRISTVARDNYGFPEMAVRTGFDYEQWREQEPGCGHPLIGHHEVP
jgi:hypothetical protein